MRERIGIGEEGGGEKSGGEEDHRIKRLQCLPRHIFGSFVLSRQEGPGEEVRPARASCLIGPSTLGYKLRATVEEA